MLQLLDYNKILDTGFQILVEDLKADRTRVTQTDLHVPLKKERILMNEAMEKLQLRTFCFDGIYDITQLISEYGCPYESFVNNAFSSPEQYARSYTIILLHCRCWKSLQLQYTSGQRSERIESSNSSI